MSRRVINKAHLIKISRKDNTFSINFVECFWSELAQLFIRYQQYRAFLTSIYGINDCKSIENSSNC